MITVALVVVIAVLFGCGFALLLERSLTRIVLGLALLANGVNLLIMSGGHAGGAPIVGVTPEPAMSDPLTQAMVLTSIVITLAVTAFLLAMAYRSWQLASHDEVPDDAEDRRIMRLAGADEPPEPGEEGDDAPARVVLRKGHEDRTRGPRP